MAANIRKFNLFEISVISLFWLLLFSSPLLLGQTGGRIDWNHVFKIWKEHSALLALFLLNRFILLPFLFFRDKQAIYVVSVIFFIGVAVTGMYMYDKKPPKEVRARPENFVREEPRTGNQGQPPPPPYRKQRGPQDQARPEPRRGPQDPVRSELRRGRQDPVRSEPVPAYVNLMILSVLVIGFDTGLKTASKWIRSEQQRIILEKDNIETRLAFLKHQISPHFFMNTLNNIHSLIDIDKVEAKKAVIKLSNLMRHLLYDSDDDFSPLKSEVDFIRSYVDLMRIRYSKDVKITLALPEEIPDKSIPPLIFISLLENAFKHGISYVNPSFINIELSIYQSLLHFRIQNSNSRESSKTNPSGIGITNTRKRLDLLYGDNYILEITDKGDTFVTDLTIPVC